MVYNLVVKWDNDVALMAFSDSSTARGPFWIGSYKTSDWPDSSEISLSAKRPGLLITCVMESVLVMYRSVLVPRILECGLSNHDFSLPSYPEHPCLQQPGRHLSSMLVVALVNIVRLC